MAFPQTHSQRRAPRIRFGAAVPAQVQAPDGQRSKANLHSVSMTGGLLRLTRALSQGDFVEVAFETQSGMVRGLAEMLSPGRPQKDGTLQAFRFVALGNSDHRTLRMMVDSATDRNFLEFLPHSLRKDS
jgi:hypothetical protein